MQDAQRGSTDGAEDGTNTGVSRRTVLRTTSAAVVGAAGLGVASGSVAADTDEISEIDFREGTPPITDAPQGDDEVVFHVHGYSGSSYSVQEAARFQETARELDYSETVAAVTWDDSGGVYEAVQNARDAGESFADWLGDYVRANPETTVRILGHSMGGIVTMETLAAIDGEFQVANADTIGSYERRDAPCRGSGYFDAIANSCGGAFNYRSDDDGLARLGSAGASCRASETPSNYRDVDVTDVVDGHTAYKSSRGCVRRILENHVDDGGGGDDPGVSVATGTASDVGAEGARVSGSLTGLGGAGSAAVRFEYRETGASSWSRTDGRTLSSPGTFDRAVSGLAPDTEYVFRAAAEASDGDVDTGDPATFTTESAGDGVAPTVDSLDYSRSCYWGCDLDVTWTVSDADGDLDAVSAVLVGSDGDRIDAASTDVSGSMASGSLGLEYSWFDDPDRVRVEVVDEAGNVGSDLID